MKILISACVYGEDVRWNGSNRHHHHIHEWANKHGYELVPICPEHELFGTPRSTIRLRSVDGEVKAFAGKREVYSQLQDKSQEIASRYTDAVGFIGISRSPTCGMSAGVKDYGTTIKAPMHQAVECPSTEISSDHGGWKVGLLKEYHTWEKIATIIYEGKEVRVMAGLTQLHKRAKRTQPH